MNFEDYQNLLQLEITLCTEVGTSINSLGKILILSHSNLQYLALNHASLDRDSVLLRMVFQTDFSETGVNQNVNVGIFLKSVYKTPKEPMDFRRLDFYKSITFMMMSVH